MNPAVSIIICSSNRADSLAGTLASIGRAEIPPDLPTELLIVDNASTDGTKAVAEGAGLRNVALRCAYEPRPGKGYAYNTGLRLAAGQVLLFTDDDVRVPVNWVEGMCRPILSGAADAVAGGVKVAAHLLRPWMGPLHRSWLASTEYLTQESPEEMVGANMAFSRNVLERVPAFDVELGPGALGFSDESLFSWQLLRAGYRIAAGFDVAVEHHCDASRLTRRSFARMAAARGRCEAYLRHHWKHEGVVHPRRQWLGAVGRLWLLRLARWRTVRRHEGMDPWEMYLIEHVEMLHAWPRESARRRGYARYGLVKLADDAKAEPRTARPEPSVESS